MAEDWHKLVVMAAIAFVVLGIVGIAVPVWRQLAALDASHVANSNIADYRMSEGRGIVIWQCRLMVLQYFQSLLASPSPQNLAAVAAVAASLLTFMLANGDLFGVAMYGAKITHATSSPYYLYRAFPRPIILISGLALLMYAKNLGPPLTITPSDSENLRPPNPKLPNTRNATSRSGAKTPTGRPASFMPKPESLKLYSAQNCVPFSGERATAQALLYKCLLRKILFPKSLLPFRGSVTALRGRPGAPGTSIRSILGAGDHRWPGGVGRV